MRNQIIAILNLQKSIEASVSVLSYIQHRVNTDLTARDYNPALLWNQPYQSNESIMTGVFAPGSFFPSRITKKRTFVYKECFHILNSILPSTYDSIIKVPDPASEAIKRLCRFLDLLSIPPAAHYNRLDLAFKQRGAIARQYIDFLSSIATDPNNIVKLDENYTSDLQDQYSDSTNISSRTQYRHLARASLLLGYDMSAFNAGQLDNALKEFFTHHDKILFKSQKPHKTSPRTGKEPAEESMEFDTIYRAVRKLYRSEIGRPEAPIPELYSENGFRRLVYDLISGNLTQPDLEKDTPEDS